MPILVKRADGSSTPYKNAEYIPAFLMIPEELLKRCGKELYELPRTRAGLTEVSVIVADIDRDAAIVQMVDSNLHREHLLPSEKAFAYKMKLEAMKHQGKRGDQSFSQDGKRSNSYEELAETVGESRNQIHRYIRLTNLIPELLECMDRGEMALTVGEALSYLDEEMQYAVLEAMGEQECKPSLSQACRMKKLFSDEQLTEDDVFDILAEEKANQREMVKIPLDALQIFLNIFICFPLTSL